MSRATEPPWATLDPGIVETVRALWDQHDTIDSGDGVHKFRNGTAAALLALTYPHVVIACTPYRAPVDAERIAELVASWGDRFVGETASSSYDICTW